MIIGTTTSDIVGVVKSFPNIVRREYVVSNKKDQKKKVKKK